MTEDYVFRRAATCLLIFVSFKLNPAAQNTTPLPNPAPANQTSTALDATAYDDAGYRQLDPILQFFRQRSAREYTIDKTKGIDDASFVPLGALNNGSRFAAQIAETPCCSFSTEGRARQPTCGRILSSSSGKTISRSCSGTNAERAGRSEGQAGRAPRT